MPHDGHLEDEGGMEGRGRSERRRGGGVRGRRCEGKEVVRGGR